MCESFDSQFLELLVVGMAVPRAGGEGGRGRICPWTSIRTKGISVVESAHAQSGAIDVEFPEKYIRCFALVTNICMYSVIYTYV